MVLYRQTNPPPFQEPKIDTNTSSVEADKEKEKVDEKPEVESDNDKDTADPSKPKVFRVVDTGVRGLVALQLVGNEDPVGFISYVFSQLLSGSPALKHNWRNTQRFTPLQVTCEASLPKIQKLAEGLFPLYFKDQEPTTYGIAFRGRNNQNIERLECIKLLASLIPAPHTVNLSSPKLLILVEVFKSICGISVVPQFSDLKKFNILSLTPQRPNKETPKEESSEKDPSASV